MFSQEAQYLGRHGCVLCWMTVASLRAVATYIATAPDRSAGRLGGASLAPTFVNRELHWRRLTLLLLGTVKKGPVEWVFKIGTNWMFFSLKRDELNGFSHRDQIYVFPNRTSRRLSSASSNHIAPLTRTTDGQPGFLCADRSMPCCRASTWPFYELSTKWKYFLTYNSSFLSTSSQWKWQLMDSVQQDWQTSKTSKKR